MGTDRPAVAAGRLAGAVEMHSARWRCTRRSTKCNKELADHTGMKNVTLMYTTSSAPYKQPFWISCQALELRSLLRACHAPAVQLLNKVTCRHGREGLVQLLALTGCSTIMNSAWGSCTTPSQSHCSSDLQHAKAKLKDHMRACCIAAPV